MAGESIDNDDLPELDAPAVEAEDDGAGDA
jgi:hypothetical protein